MHLRLALALALALALGFTALLPAGCASSAPSAPAPSAPSPLLGKPLKDFRRPTLSGNVLDTETLRGRVVVVEFFAEYCKPCERTLPEAVALSRELAHVSFIGISEDEHASAAERLTRRHAVPFPVIHDAGNVLAGRFRVSEMPATFVIDPRGTVRWVGTADHSTEDLRRAIVEAERNVKPR